MGMVVWNGGRKAIDEVGGNLECDRLIGKGKWGMVKESEPSFKYVVLTTFYNANKLGCVRRWFQVLNAMFGECWGQTEIFPFSIRVDYNYVGLKYFSTTDLNLSNIVVSSNFFFHKINLA